MLRERPITLESARYHNMLLYLHDDFALHDTGQHPECPQRIERVNAWLRRVDGVVTRAHCVDHWAPAKIAQCSKNHDIGYLTTLQQQIVGLTSGTHQRIEADTVVCSQSWDVAMLAAGAAIDAVKRVIRGDDRNAFVAARPPGHHAIATGPMGFCLVNNVAIAAREAIASGLERVLIVDFDVHHGNGTQDVFYDDPRVAFFSIHRYPFYPGTGSETQTGTADGLGGTCNVPIRFGTPVKQMIDAFKTTIEAFAAKQRPELILVSAGFDAHRDDPVGSLGLENEDFATLTDWLTGIATEHCDGRLVSLLEGGYHLDRLPECVEIHTTRLLADTDANLNRCRPG